MRYKLTPVFPAHIKPRRRGLYKTFLGNAPAGYSRWDGKRWGIPGKTIDEALHLGHIAALWQERRWQGRRTP